MRLSEPAADLAVALAVASAVHDRALPVDVVAIGELGLSGELRPVGGVQRRLAEAARLGFTRAIVPTGSGTPPDGMRVSEVDDLQQSLIALDNLARTRPQGPRRPLNLV